MQKYLLTSVLLLAILLPSVAFADPFDGDDIDSVPACLDLGSYLKGTPYGGLKFGSRDIYTNGAVSALQQFLLNRGSLSPELTNYFGYFGTATLSAVKAFQSAYYPELVADGKVGPKTIAKIKEVSCGGVTIPTPDPVGSHGCLPGYKYSATTGKLCADGTSTFPPGCTSTQGYSTTTGEKCDGSDRSVVIDGVSGPQTLTVRETGTWTVKAHGSGGNLFYRVVWGDENTTGYTGSTSVNAPFQQSTTFTHSYASAGTYTPTFYVQNNIGEGAKTSISVRVGATASPIISAILPPGCAIGAQYSSQTGEICTDARLGDVIDIVGKNFYRDMLVISCVPSQCINDFRYITPTFISSTRLQFKIPAEAKSGLHQIRVGVADSGGASESQMSNWVNLNFVNPGTTTQPSITVLTPNGGEMWAQGTTQIIKWSASCYLKYFELFDVKLIKNDEDVIQNVRLSVPGNPHACLSNEGNLTHEFQWTIPSSIPLGNNYKIKVFGYNQAAAGVYADFSNAAFTITSPTPQSQTFSISGKILQSNGDPAIATISVGGKATSTSIDGRYSLTGIPVSGSGISLNTDGKTVTANVTATLVGTSISKTWQVGAAIGTNTDFSEPIRMPAPAAQPLTSSLTFVKVPSDVDPSSNLTATFSNTSNQLYRMSWSSTGADRCVFVNNNLSASQNYTFINALLAKFIYQSSYQANKFTSGTLDFYIGPDGPSGSLMKNASPSFVNFRCYQGTTSTNVVGSLLIQ